MRKLLLLRPNNRGQVYWAKLSETLVTEAEGTLDTPDLLLDAAKDTRTVLLYPAVDSLITKVEAPNVKRQQLPKVIPFALEDQLNASVDKQHYAIGERDEEGQVPVCVVDRNKFDALYNELDEMGLHLDACFADTFAIPWEEHSWTILIEGSSSIIRQGEETGFALDTENLGVMLEIMLSECDDETRPERIRLLNATTKPINLRIPGIDVHFEDCAGRTFAMFANHIDDSKPISLLTGQYSPRKKQMALWENWKSVAVLAGVAILGASAVNHIQAFQLASQKKATFKEMVSLYQKTFPENKRQVLNPAGQMKSKYKAMSGEAIDGQIEFLDLLAKIGPMLKSAPGAELQAMTFRSSGIEVDIVLRNLQGLDQLKQNLTRVDDVEVEVKNANSEKDSVRSKLLIRAKS